MVQTDKVSVENNPERIISETTNLFQSKAPKWARFGTLRKFRGVRSEINFDPYSSSNFNLTKQEVHT